MKVYPQDSLAYVFLRNEAGFEKNGNMFTDHIAEETVKNYEKSLFTKHTYMENYLWSRYNQPKILLGHMYMIVQNFAKAIELFRQIPKKELVPAFVNPFKVNTDRRNIDYETTYSSNQKIPNVLDIAKKMFQLEKKLANPKYANDVLLNYEFANGLYNLSGRGNFRDAVSLVYFNGAYTLSGKGNLGYADMMYRIYDGIPRYLQRAEKHYKIAIAFSKKPEFQAEIAYQLLKTQQIKLDKKDYDYYAKTYQNTNFGKMMIEECINFRQLQFNY
jgi:tetratricopeptide (TPR) repeat protein